MTVKELIGVLLECEQDALVSVSFTGETGCFYGGGIVYAVYKDTGRDWNIFLAADDDDRPLSLQSLERDGTVLYYTEEV